MYKLATHLPGKGHQLGSLPAKETLVVLMAYPCVWLSGPCFFMNREKKHCNTTTNPTFFLPLLPCGRWASMPCSVYVHNARSIRVPSPIFPVQSFLIVGLACRNMSQTLHLCCSHMKVKSLDHNHFPHRAALPSSTATIPLASTTTTASRTKSNARGTQAGSST